jgi:hypothetical protein
VAVTAPNPRLVHALERYTGLQLAAKAFITPNSLPFPAATADKPAQPPSQIIWIQSDIAALDRSRREVVSAVEKFSEKYGLPVILIGRNVLDGPQFRHQVVMGEIDFTANLQLLATAPLSLGVAPLETKADWETLDFVAGKSDLKILLFAGYGHAGVYSAAPPYTDSNLQNGLSIVANSAPEWMEALEYEFREGWKRMSAIARDIQAERNVDKVARENWLPAIEAARLSRPITGAELFEIYESRFQMEHSSMHSLAYLAGNEDILACCLADENYGAWTHFQEYGHAEHRLVRHGLAGQRELMKRIEGEGAKAMAELDQEMRSFTEESTNLKQQILELEQLRGKLQQQKERLEEHKQRLEEKNDSLEEQIAKLEKQTLQLQLERQELIQQTRPLQDQCDHLKDQKDSLAQHKQRLAEKNDLLEAQNEQLLQQSHALGEQNQNLQSQMEALQAQKQDLQQQTLDLQEQKRALEAEKRRLEEETIGLEQQQEELVQRSHQLQQENADLQQESADLQQENADLQQENADLQQRNDTLNATLSAIFASKSWRLTAPLRNLTSRVRS